MERTRIQQKISHPPDSCMPEVAASCIRLANVSMFASVRKSVGVVALDTPCLAIFFWVKSDLLNLKTFPDHEKNRMGENDNWVSQKIFTLKIAGLYPVERVQVVHYGS